MSTGSPSSTGPNSSSGSIQDWVPAEQGLKEMLNLLTMSKRPDTQIQREVSQKLDFYKQNVPEFNNYLAYAFAKMPQLDEQVRSVAGLTLKNNIREQAKVLDPLSMQMLHIKNLVILALDDPVLHIRSTAGSVVTCIVEAQGLHTWPEVLPMLVQLMDQNSGNPAKATTVEGAIGALLKICEDCGDKLLGDEPKASKNSPSGNGAGNRPTTPTSPAASSLGRPLNVLIPKFIQYFQYPHSYVVRFKALNCCIQFIEWMPNALVVNMQSFLQGVVALASDKNKQVRKYVCRAFILICEHHSMYLNTIFDDVVKYMLVCCGDDDEMLALEACNFWSMLVESERCAHLVPRLKPYVNDIIPVLLKCMVYSEMERAMLDTDTQRADRDSDIAPQKLFVQARTVDMGKGGATNQPTFGQGGTIESEEEEEDDEGDEEDDEFEYGEQDWNLRKSAAASLDLFSHTFRNDILPSLLATVQDRIQPHQPWEVRESAILALGAVAEGCSTGMYAHLPDLIPYLVRHLADPKPLIRSITCWTLSRYNKWIVQQPSEKFFAPVLSAILRCVTDRNKRVQEAACSSFAAFEEVAGTILVPFIGPILQTTFQAFKLYHKKNLLILYDAISTLCDQVGEELNRQEYIQLLMPPLIEKWERIPDHDRTLFPLLECLACIAAALKQGFAVFAQPVFDRCMRLVQNVLVNEDAAKQMGQTIEQEEKDAIIVSLDLIGQIVGALKQNSQQLIAQSKLLDVLLRCAQDELPDVKQSAYGVLGDLAKLSIPQLTVHVKHFLPLMLEQMDPHVKTQYHPNAIISLCNNAIWSAGELAMQIKGEMAPYVSPIMQKLLPIINDKKLHISVLENTAILIGRLGLVCPDQVAPIMPHFAQRWLATLRNIRDDIEKVQTYQGLCVLTRKNPHVVASNLVYFCDAVAFYDEASPELKQEFHTLLTGFKNSLPPAEWQRQFQAFPDDLRHVLTTVYHL